MIADWNKLDAMPPILCRMLAHKRDNSKQTRNRVALTSAEVVARAKFKNKAMSVADVVGMAYRLDWLDVPLWQVFAFVNGCGLERAFTNRREWWHLHDIKKAIASDGLPGWVVSSPEFKTVIKPLAEYWVRGLGKDQ